VVIPCLNDAAYIREALDSVFGQTLPPEEIIVADGGSTDGTADILNSYRGRLTWFRQEGKGVSAAKNQAVARTRGEYIAFLDADDLWYPEKLERQTALLDRCPEYGFCSSDVDFFDESGVFIHGAIGTEKQPRSGYVFDELFVNNFISSATIMLRRFCFDRVGGFDENIRFAEDTEMWLRVAKEFRLGYIPEVLAAYRVRRSSRSFQFAEHYRSLGGTFDRFLGKYPDYFKARPGLMRNARYNLYRRWGYRHFEVGEYRRARGLFLRALRRRPSAGMIWKYLAASLLPPSVLRKLRKHRGD